MSAYLYWQSGTAVTGIAQNILAFDIVKSESHDHTNTVTEHPVEQGSNVIDHIRPNLNKVTIEGFISNAPVYSGDAQRDTVVLNLPQPPPQHNIGGLVDLLAGSQPIISVQVQDFAGQTDYVAKCFATLELLRSQGTLVSIAQPNGANYDNMIVSSFKMDRDDTSGTGADFTVELTEVRIVASSITDAPLPSIPQANTTKSTGSQAAQDPGPKKTLLTKALDSIGIQIAGGAP